MFHNFLFLFYRCKIFLYILSILIINSLSYCSIFVSSSCPMICLSYWVFYFALGFLFEFFSDRIIFSRDPDNHPGVISAGLSISTFKTYSFWIIFCVRFLGWCSQSALVMRTQFLLPWTACLRVLISLKDSFLPRGWGCWLISSGYLGYIDRDVLNPSWFV